MDPFDIFPVKVWEEILDRVGDPHDKLNLIKTNRSLELLELFQDMKAEWHFSTVLKILLGHFCRNQHTYVSVKKPWHWHGKTELKSAILNCRRVSKGTKKIVDNFVADYWEKHCCIPPFATPTEINCLELANKCLTQAEQLKKCSASPFISGLLYLHCGEGWTVDQDDVIIPCMSLEKAAQLFSHPNIGNKLRGIRVLFSYRADDLQGTCNFVRKLLHSVPNILNLAIHFLPTGNQAEEVDVEVAEVDIFPELPYLKHLEVCESVNNDEAKSTLRHYVDFKQYFEQLTNLEMSISLWKEEYNGRLVQFPQLKSLLINKIPIVGWKRNILGIVEKFKIAPALQYLTFESTRFDKLGGLEGYCSWMNYMHWKVFDTLNPRTSTQEWSMGWSEFTSSLDHNMISVFEFSKVLK